MSKKQITSICAFDIGIKNLSFCILLKQDTKNIIKKWELIDLRNGTLECIGKNKKNEICGKKAIFSCFSNQKIAYCKNHASQYNYSEPIKIKKSKNTNKSKSKSKNKTDLLCNCMDINTSTKCNKEGCYQLDENIYCSEHYNQYKKSHKLLKVKNISCMGEPLYDLGTHLYKKLDENGDILNVDKIVIENQPSLTNPTMKSISILLLSYFIMKKHPCVEFVSPSGKLKVNDTLTKQILLKCPSKSIKYAITKELGIKYSNILLQSYESNDKWFDILNKSKKKDDLCDAFLHAFYHMYGNGFITSKTDIDALTKYFDEKIKTKKNNKIKNTKDKENTIKLL